MNGTTFPNFFRNKAIEVEPGFQLIIYFKKIVVFANVQL